jgi:Trypsin-co-occurring domain 1
VESQTKIIDVELSDGTVVKVEATPLGEQRVAFQSRPFREATAAIKSIAYEVAHTLQNVKDEIKPDKLSVKLGLEIAIESGQLTALIVKGAGKANFEIVMEWNNSP